MHGTEPFLQDMGLVPLGVVGEKESSLHLYRRNSCQQERLNHDLKRLQQQEERVIRRANREIIDLNMEQKQRREILLRGRRDSECIGTHRHFPELENVHFGSFGEHAQSIEAHPAVLALSASSRRSPQGSASSTGRYIPRRRASISAPVTLPALSGTSSTTFSDQRPRSKSYERISPTFSTTTTESISNLQETYIDAKSRKDLTRLRKASERCWRSVPHNKAGERTGKPPIPTSSFTASSAGGENVNGVHKTTQVFDRLSLDTKHAAMSSDNFLKVLRKKNRIRDASHKT